jgi:hypothetical protein
LSTSQTGYTDLVHSFHYQKIPYLLSDLESNLRLKQVGLPKMKLIDDSSNSKRKYTLTTEDARCQRLYGTEYFPRILIEMARIFQISKSYIYIRISQRQFRKLNRFFISLQYDVFQFLPVFHCNFHLVLCSKWSCCCCTCFGLCCQLWSKSHKSSNEHLRTCKAGNRSCNHRSCK